MSEVGDIDDRASVIGHDERFFNALTAADTIGLSDLVSEDFILIGVNDGSPVTKSQLIETVGAGFVRFLRIESFPDEAIVRRAGAGAAIVIGRTRMTLSIAGGDAITVNSRYTHVFTAAGNGWQLSSAQGTEIKTDTPA
jgi:ketosteroid isomerase-like protein